MAVVALAPAHLVAQTSNEPDSAAFAAIIGWAQATPAFGVLKVDPRPLATTRPEGVESHGLFLGGQGAVAAERALVLRRLGVDSVDLGDVPNCVGSLVLPQFRPAKETCPDSTESWVALGLVAVEGEGIRGLPSNWRDGVEGRTWTVYARVRIIRRNGYVETGRVLILQLETGRWRVAKDLVISVTH